MRNKVNILIISSILGVSWATYLLYNRRGGYMKFNDFIAIGIVCVFLFVLINYFMRKWKNEE